MTLSFKTLGFWSAALLATTVMATGCASGDGEDNTDDGDGDASTGGTTAGDGDGDTGGSMGDGDGDGTGGAAPGPTSVCDDNSFPPAAAEVSDLEDGVAGWDFYQSTEGEGALTVPADGSLDDDPELVTDDGADETSQSVGYAGTGFATYGSGINFNLEGCKDLEAYEGVTFWVKGSATVAEEDQQPPTAKDNSVNFRVITAGSHAIIMDGGVNVGGDCDVSVTPNKCFMPPQIDVPLTEEWVKHEIKFSELKTPPGANPGSAFSGTNAMLLGWHTSAADVEIYLDEVEFF